MAYIYTKHGKKITKKINKIKNTKIKIKCVGGGGGGGNLHYLLCLISNTLPQLEQPSLHPQQFSVIASCCRPSPSSPTPPQLQKRKTEGGGGGGW